MSEQLSSLREFELNYGPQHPAAHGVMRLKLTIDGERIKAADTHIGFLHRGVEKLIENKTYLQALPYFERLDYVSPANCVHGFILAVEKLAQIEVPVRAKYLRVMILELTRIANHLLMLGSMAMDLGAITPIFFAFEAREKIFEMMEKISGARMHNNFLRFGGVKEDVKSELLEEILNWNDNEISQVLDDIEELLTENPIFKQRTVGIGVIDKKTAIANGFTGPNLRACGVAWDLREKQPYECYGDLDFNVVTATSGDSYARYLVRVYEIRESIKIIRQVINKMPEGQVRVENYKIVPPDKDLIKNDGSANIHFYSLFSKGMIVPQGEVYTAVEAPKGEFGVFLVGDGTNTPYRCKIRAPGFAYLQALPILAEGHLLPDINAILGSLDLVFGEIDR